MKEASTAWQLHATKQKTTSCIKIVTSPIALEKVYVMSEILGPVLNMLSSYVL